jgi:hypothetical protein
MEYLSADHTEIWAPSAVLPLIQFADVAHSLVASGVDVVAVGDLHPPETFVRRVQSFDSVVSWYGTNRPQFRDALLAINPKTEFHAALPQDSALHATDFFARQVGAPVGLVPRIRVHAEKRASIVIHPFSGSAKKNWPLDRYRELAKHLPLPIDWLAGPEDHLPDANRFENLLDVVRFIAGARLYIGNDSGITHLAAAAGAKTLAMFGSASPKIWAPRGDNVEVIAVNDLRELTVDSLVRIVNRLLDSPAS